MIRAAVALTAALAVLIAAAPAGAADKPRFAKSVLLKPLSGAVLLKEPGHKQRRLRKASLVKLGSRVNTTAGKVRLTSAKPGGKLQAARFNGAPFLVTQPRRQKGLTDLKLDAKLDCSAGAASSARRKRLFGSGHGRFRTRGRNSSATVRGTTWITTDDCSGTEITSVEGDVQTQADGVDLSRLLQPGQSVIYFCHLVGRTQLENGTYCTLVLSQPADGVLGVGIAAFTDESVYQLCLYYPDGTPDCGELPLSEQEGGYKQGIVVCAVHMDGVYTARWGLQGQALFPDLRSAYMKGTGQIACQADPNPGLAPAGAALRTGSPAPAGHAIERAAPPAGR